METDTEKEIRLQDIEKKFKESIKSPLSECSEYSPILKDDHVTFRDLLTAVMGMQVITAAIIWLTILITRGTI